jgi:hypothetical protein
MENKLRKYSSLEEAREAKLKKDKEYYRKRKGGEVEDGVIGRKSEKTLEEILEKDRIRNIRSKERKKLLNLYKDLPEDEIEKKLEEIMKSKELEPKRKSRCILTIEERRAKSNERVKRWLERKKLKMLEEIK